MPSMGIIRSEAVVIVSSGNAPKTTNLLGLVSEELHKSLDSAISSLTFSVSRDVFMSAISSLRCAVAHHQGLEDSKAVLLCSELVVAIQKGMRRRYLLETVPTSFSELDDGATVPKQGDGADEADSQAVENLIVGGALPKNDVDFVSNPPDVSQALASPMGWAHYKGLGAALRKCDNEDEQRETPEEEAQMIMSNINSFIDEWDKLQKQDKAEFVDLFSSDDFDDQGSVSEADGVKTSIATEAITRFVDAQSVLIRQHQYLAFEYLAQRRRGRTSFAERLSWKTWMDFADTQSSNDLWEHAMSEGGRDSSSRIVTIPLFPAFPRFIPSYLDHSPASLSMDMNKTLTASLSMSVKIVDITKTEVSDEMLKLFEDDDAAISEEEEEEIPEVFTEEDSDLHFGRRRSSFMSSVMSDGPSVISEEGDAHEEGEAREASAAELTARHDLQLANGGTLLCATSSFSFPPDSSSLNSMGDGMRFGGGALEEYYSSCLHVRPDASVKCKVLITESHLIIEHEEEGGTEDQPDDKSKSACPQSLRWNISEASHIYLRRFRLRDSALEIFFIPSAGTTTGGSAIFAGSRSLFIDFGRGSWGNTRRDDAANAIMKRAPMQTVKQWPDKSGHFLHEELKKLMHAWTNGAISNFDYLMSLNILSGRSFNDICQYPVMPWVISNYTSAELDLTDKSNFRDLSKPMGALNELRLAELVDRFETFDDQIMPPFMYGSHYSTSAGVVIHFLLRMHPFSSLHRQLQSGHFDVADRLFSSVQRTWEMCTGRSAAEVKELTPEFYSNPAFLRNSNCFKLGTSQDGEVLGDVVLPPWAEDSPEKFVEIMRLALESDVCSKMLPDWIDLIFGYKQQGKAAIEAQNVFFYL